MAILRRISSLFTFKPTEPAPDIPSSPTVVDSHHRDNLQERSVFTERPTHIPKAVFSSPPAEKITLNSFIKNRQSLSPGTKVRGYLLSTAIEQMESPKKRSRGNDDTAGSIEGKMKKTKLSDDTTTGSIERRMKKAKIVDETELEDELDGSTMVDIAGEVQDDEAEEDEAEDDEAGDDGTEDDEAEDEETTDEEDEGMDMDGQEGDDADATLADQAESSSPFKLPLYPASQQHKFRSIGVGESATTAKAFNSIDIKNKRTLNVPASPTTTDMFVDSDTLLSAGWPDDTLVLIQKLHHRGREPILPSHWSMDFHFLPDALFTPISAADTAFVRAQCYGRKRDFHATKALQTLFQLSSRVRDKVHARMAPESLIEKGFQAYIAWAYGDSGLSTPVQPSLPGKRRSSSAGAAIAAEPPLPPLVLTHTAPRTLDSKTLEKGVLTRLINLRQDWINYIASYPTSAAPQGYLREREEPPTIYAVVVSHTNVAMVAFSGQDLRQIGHFDFGVVEFDVWNAIALAVLAVHARNVAGAVWEEYEGGDFVEVLDDDMDVEEAEEDDPDA